MCPFLDVFTGLRESQHVWGFSYFKTHLHTALPRDVVFVFLLTRGGERSSGAALRARDRECLPGTDLPYWRPKGSGWTYKGSIQFGSNHVPLPYRDVLLHICMCTSIFICPKGLVEAEQVPHVQAGLGYKCLF